MQRSFWPTSIALVCAIALAYVTAIGNLSIAVDDPYPEFADATLQAGRGVWLETCKACHTSDFAGAPRVTDKNAWAPRLAKGKEALYASAINGRFGPQGTEMPARGSNPQLTDAQVRAAVDYMVALVTR